MWPWDGPCRPAHSPPAPCTPPELRGPQGYLVSQALNSLTKNLGCHSSTGLFIFSEWPRIWCGASVSEVGAQVRPGLCVGPLGGRDPGLASRPVRALVRQVLMDRARWPGQTLSWPCLPPLRSSGSGWHLTRGWALNQLQQTGFSGAGGQPRVPAWPRPCTGKHTDPVRGRAWGQAGSLGSLSCPGLPLPRALLGARWRVFVGAAHLSAPAGPLCLETPPDALVLESPFTNIREEAKSHPFSVASTDLTTDFHYSNNYHQITVGKECKVKIIIVKIIKHSNEYRFY